MIKMPGMEAGGGGGWDEAVSGGKSIMSVEGPPQRLGQEASLATCEHGCVERLRIIGSTRYPPRDRTMRF